MDANMTSRCVRWVGALYVLTIIAGGWGESQVPSTLLIANDVAGTAQRVAQSLGLFRASFIAYLVEACCDITLNVLLYALLRPVSRQFALLALCFGLIATAIYAAGELVYFAAALPILDVDVARVVEPAVKAELTYLCLTLYGYVNGIFAVFYGTAAVIRGSLMVRSSFIPRAIGILFIAGGLGFIAKNLLVVGAPRYDQFYILLPMFVAMLSWTIWSIVKGIDRPAFHMGIKPETTVGH